MNKITKDAVDAMVTLLCNDAAGDLKADASNMIVALWARVEAAERERDHAKQDAAYYDETRSAALAIRAEQLKELRGTIAQLEAWRADFAESVQKIADKADTELARYRAIMRAISDTSLPWTEIKDEEGKVLVAGNIATPAAIARLTRERDEAVRARSKADEAEWDARDRGYVRAST